eukprot:scaffold851_cov67-Phaeocystis_antarctica.AAC.6
MIGCVRRPRFTERTKPASHQLGCLCSRARGIARGVLRRELRDQGEAASAGVHRAVAASHRARDRCAPR